MTDGLWPALELGGSHVTSGLVSEGNRRVVAGTVQRFPIDSAAAATEILATVARAAAALDYSDGACCGFAVPGPFDYEAGIARYRDVGKFESLRGVDVRAELAHRLLRPLDLRFLNDAAAFGLGEVISRGLPPDRRAVAITLGTGVGSAFLAGRRVVAAGADVPPEGRVDLLRIGDRALEDVVSTRAILGTYRRVTGVKLDGLQALAALARQGDAAARSSIDTALGELGTSLGPWLDRFGAEVLIVGGSFSAAWDLIEPALRSGLRRGSRSRLPDLQQSSDTEGSTLVGAALAVRERQETEN